MGWFDGKLDVGSHSGRRHSHSPRPSLFGGRSYSHNSSRSSFFGGRSSSYYKRSPRSGYFNRMLHKLRRLLRDLLHYMKKNPLKVFMLVIMPLLTGGALTKLLATFGVRLPGSLDRMFGGARSSSMLGRSRGDFDYERRGAGGSSMDAIMGMAKMFV